VKYPLLFSYRDLIAGNGFVAGVEMRGRVVLAQEDDGAWMYGVQPGGIAGGNAQREVAYRRFKESYLSVLFDIAAEAKTFKQFEKAVREFFGEINEPNARDWQAALAEVRRRPTSLAGLPSLKAESQPPRLRVVLLAGHKTKPTANEFDVIAEAA